MNQEIEDAYNEWLLKFGYRWVSGMEIDAVNMDEVGEKLDQNLWFRVNQETPKYQYKLKQPHEIK